MENKKKAVILTSDAKSAERVIAPSVKIQLQKRYDLYDKILYKENLEQYIRISQEAEYIFSTWGMEHFSEEEIKKYFPKVKCIFYAAGSVQHFAKEFLKCGIRVFSAWKANAIPVAEYTYAQILLATKGFFQAARTRDGQYSECCGGNYLAKIGIIGVGSIGHLVAQKLETNDMEVFYYDPFLPEETAQELGIKPYSLDEIFSQCDVITNHLADKEELTGILSGTLFEKMKPYATFINTGRGRQVDHKGLLRAMKQVDTRTALLDVTEPEPLPPSDELCSCRNVIITPHIAGSIGREVIRMAQFMSEEAARIDGGKMPLFEVTIDMLKNMA